jgi:uncharacterized protein YceK
MRRIWIVLMVLVGGVLFKGCSSIEEYDVVKYKAPNWTSDGTIVFVKDHNHVKDKKSITGEEGNIKGSSEKLILCEINNDGTGFKEIATMLESNNYAYSLGITNTSSAGEWVVMGMKAENDSKEHIYIIKRDGIGLSKICEGNYPDFSPDAEKIVYQKPDQGLWIMNRDGSGEHQITSDGNAVKPVWAPGGNRIAYTISQSETLCISDTSGTIISIYTPLEGGWYEEPDWAPKDTNAVITAVNGRGWSEIIYLSTGQIQKNTLVWYTKWSSIGDKFITYDGHWYVINRDGTNKWYLKP